MKRKLAKRKVAVRVKRQPKIIKPDDLPWPDDWSPETVGLSQSLIGRWLFCQRAFLFSINGYAQPIHEEKTNFGSIVHDVNDVVYTKGKSPTSKQIVSAIDNYCEKRVREGTLVTQQQLETDSAKAEAILIPYFEFYAKDFTRKRFYDAEWLFKTRFNGQTMRGKVDLKYLTKKKKKWLKEHKTKGQINEDGLLRYLPLDFQSHFYLLADFYDTGTYAEGMLYNVIRNTQAKPLKNERLITYKKKIMEQCRKNPSHYYKRWETTYTKQEREIFNADLGHITYSIKHRMGMHVYPNTFNCLKPWPCEFLRACSENSCACLVKKNEPPEVRLFPELQEDNNGSKKSRGEQKKRKSARRSKKKTKK